jgi:hypothetical protein
VNEVTLRRQLARTAHIVRRHARRAKRIDARDADVVGDDVAVFEGEHVECPEELFAFEEKRYGERAASPRRSKRRACCQVGESETLDQRKAVHQAGRRRGSVQTIGHHRQQAAAKEAPEIRRQSFERRALVAR